MSSFFLLFLNPGGDEGEGERNGRGGDGMGICAND
jgi:hypothetical protein